MGLTPGMVCRRRDVAPRSFEAVNLGVETVSEFIAAAYEGGFVLQGFDWPEWAQSEEARTLRDNDKALARASSEQLARLLTVVIRQDRFCEGVLLDAFEHGLILRIVRRAAVILERTR